MRSTLSSDTKFKVAFGAWWFTAAELHFIILNNFGLPFPEAIADSLVSNILLALGCLLISMNMKYYLPGKERFWYLLVISFALSLVWLLIMRLVLWYLFKDDKAYLLMLSHSSILRYFVAFLMLACMATLSLLWYTQQEQKEMDARKADAEKLAREAELFKLRQQLQPHFLFNSLNSISALTGTQPEKARHMIQQLSDFLRGTLRKEEHQWSTLKEELEYLQLYLDIEKVRFGYRLQTSIQCEESALQMKLPSLLLQPIVENAIKFGLYDTTGEVMITISAKNKNDALEVTVSNPFDVETAQPLQGTGFGLASIKRRLFLLFARHDLLKTATSDNQFITTIEIPQIQ
ncbi:MAG TPA: histidine kinase [Chitinophagaceae bacterium]|nr:histidine kinase [Chitinophagaceae bacterium]